MYDYEKKHLEYLRTHLAECTVLLKSDGRFPLDAPCAIAAYGSGVRCTVKGGTGSGEVNSRHFATVEQGLERAGFTLTTKAWLDGYDAVREQAKKLFLDDIREQARKKHRPAMFEGMGKVMPEPEYDLAADAQGDAAIYVLARNSGEGNDRAFVRGDILLTETEKRDILALNERFDKFMLVLNVGGPVDLAEVDAVGNILLLSQLGDQTGDALADILLGRQNPSGRLTTTWADNGEYAPMADFGDPNDTRYNEGVYVGYRYFDSVGKRARYPFGYGLSYTSFETTDVRVSVEGSVVTIGMYVRNTGTRAGKTVIQAYVSAPQGRLDKPYQELAGFVKSKMLAPGEGQPRQILFDLRDQASYDEERAAYLLEAGRYIVRVGAHSADNAPAAVIELNGEALVMQAKNCCGKPDFEDWKPETPRGEELPADLPVIAVSAVQIAARMPHYGREEKIEDAVRLMTNEQLAYANVGAFSTGLGALSVVGSASSLVAGAAGESTAQLTQQGFERMVMADGPAGLRLSPRYYRDKKGANPVGQAGMPESMAQLMPAPARMALKLLSGGKPPRGAEIGEQYATALPIGTAIAQSFNVRVARACGDIVGDEMERFGVHLWLAPALNIHRTIRCGRNFEYFSEDPLLSGRIAARITQGVQSHPGCGVTIKHYAANNQETNRYGNNSIVSERAMREIYLKGFGVCVREAKPLSVMTSYNLLNGVHTAERRDLSEDILRGEFGFDGIIMTDWIIGGGMVNSKEDVHPAVRPAHIAAAGGDVVMPGCKKDHEDMLEGLKAGSLTREQLMINASRMYRMAKKLSARNAQ